MFFSGAIRYTNSRKMAWPMGMWVRMAVQNFASIGARGGNSAQNMKNLYFLVKSRPAGANRWTDF